MGSDGSDWSGRNLSGFSTGDSLHHPAQGEMTHVPHNNQPVVVSNHLLLNAILDSAARLSLGLLGLLGRKFSVDTPLFHLNAAAANMLQGWDTKKKRKIM